MRAPIRVRLTVAYAALLLLVLGGAGVLIYARFRIDRDNAIDAGLRARSDAIVAAVRSGAANDSLTNLLGDADERFGAVLDRDGRIVAASPGLAPQPLLVSARVGFHSGRLTAQEEREHVRLLTRHVGDRTLLLAQALDDRDDGLRRLATLLLIGGGLTFVAATALAWLLAGSALRPVERLRREADAYTATDLDRRLAEPPANDEVGRLARTLNRMLDRVQASFDTQRDFVDHASHELRTPLANLTTELELASRRDRTADELRTAIESAAHETQRLNRLASDLLVLARTTDGRLPLARELTDLGELIRDTSASFRARAGERDIRVVVEADAVDAIRIDPTRVRQAISNLLDNALRATPSGGTVKIGLRAAPGTVTIAVSDTGPGIGPDVREHAFEPFVRGVDHGDPNGSNADGAGLGLAIVAGVAAAHGGRATIVDAGTGQTAGTTVELVLPRP